MSELEVEDVLNPRTEWVDDSCYRVNRKQVNIKKNTNQNNETSQPYNDNEDLIQCDEDISEYDVEVLENGRFMTKIRLPQNFYAYIIGARGSTRKKLEDETKTKISIPRDSNTMIIITGSSERNVILARQKLEMIGFDLRNRHEITDFISLPLISEQIKDNFIKFKELILQDGHIDGIDETIFQKPTKIHITIGVLVLLDDYERNEAAKVLDQLKTDIIEPQLKNSSPLIIKMKGLEYMNDDPSQVDVLYAKVHVDNHENKNILQNISDNIVDYFYKNGLMRKERDNVKLHATLINTRYRKDINSDLDAKKRNRKYKRTPFDARPIMEKYSDFEFGEQILDTIHLSNRSSKDSTGYYQPIHKISCTSF